MPEQRSREVRLRSRPHGALTPDNFDLATVAVGEPGPGEVQVRNEWMSVDPYMRPRMNAQASYIAPFEIGRPLDGGAVGTVTASRDDRFVAGELVYSSLGWREAFNAPGDRLRKIESPRLPAQAYLGVAGMPGHTAYVGLLEIAGLAAGDTVFVSAASGAVGAVACQIARVKGAGLIIGSAGGAAKCAYLREIGVDRVIDYKDVPDLPQALRQAAPDGVDVYFDNVGGTHLAAAMANARIHARIALCGMISQYDAGDTTEASLPADFFNAIRHRIRMEGFVVTDYLAGRPLFVEEMTRWVEDGKIVSRETVAEGIEAAPAAFLKLFTGDNFGKMLVRLA